MSEIDVQKYTFFSFKHRARSSSKNFIIEKESLNKPIWITEIKKLELERARG